MKKHIEWEWFEDDTPFAAKRRLHLSELGEVAKWLPLFLENLSILRGSFRMSLRLSL